MSIFDFTSQDSSKQACKGRERKGYRLPMGLVGDSLVEPFGLEGLGISKSFLRVFDTAWMAERFKKGSEDLSSTTFEPTVEDGNKITQTEKGSRNRGLN